MSLIKPLPNNRGSGLKVQWVFASVSNWRALLPRHPAVFSIAARSLGVRDPRGRRLPRCRGPANGGGGGKRPPRARSGGSPAPPRLPPPSGPVSPRRLREEEGARCPRRLRPLLHAHARRRDPLRTPRFPPVAPGAAAAAPPHRPGVRRGMGGVEERGFLRGSDRTGQECAAGSAPHPACLAAVPRGALSAPPAMPHFTVVPVEDKHRAEYDSVEGLSWVDYREPAAAPAAGDSYDTVSSDGERARPGGGRRCRSRSERGRIPTQTKAALGGGGSAVSGARAPRAALSAGGGSRPGGSPGLRGRGVPGRAEELPGASPAGR